MAQNFFERLREYYLKVAEVLRGEADAASIFPNTTDIGMSREGVYVDFLRWHVPSKCNVFLGGFLFDEEGAESHQLDVIITTDTTPRYDFHNRDGSGKSFSPVEGTLGVASIKSRLDKKQLEDALLGIASIPPTKSLDGRLSLGVGIHDYDDWPYKIVYATDGIKLQTLIKHLTAFYRTHYNIPLARRPHIIHVAGKYVILRVVRGMILTSTSGEATSLEPGSFHVINEYSDLHAIAWTLHKIQLNAASSTDIWFSYGELINKVIRAPFK